MKTASAISNVALHLPLIAELRPDDSAVICQESGSYRRWTFRQLNEEGDRYAHGLGRIGIRRGTRCVLMVTPSLDFFALTFALFKIGAVIVMVDPGMGVKNLGKCLEEAEPEAFIGIPKAQVARVLFGWAKRTLKIIITAGPRWFWKGHRLQDLRADRYRPYEIVDAKADETAAILFTSGSTGPPKGAVYTHGIFCAQVAYLRDQFGIRPGEIDLATFPLFALFDPALGVTSVIPEMDFTRPADADPRKIISAIRDTGATNAFASPALLDRVGCYAEQNKIQLPTLRRVFSAGAPVAPSVLERFRTLLDSSADIFTPYGATEALPVAVIESREVLCETRDETERGGGICVGRAVEGIEVSIIKISDTPIDAWSPDLLVRAGEIGEIVVRGPVVTESYYNRPDLTALAKINPTDGGRIYHRMGDVGRMDERGRLWFCGRKNQRVETANGTLFTIPCEAIFNRHPKVFRSALVGIGANGNQTPVLCVEAEKGVQSAEHESLIEELTRTGQEFAHTRSIKNFLFRPRFPVDVRHNAKIGREKLAIWAKETIKK